MEDSNEKRCSFHTYEQTPRWPGAKLSLELGMFNIFKAHVCGAYSRSPMRNGGVKPGDKLFLAASSSVDEQ